MLYHDFPIGENNKKKTKFKYVYVQIFEINHSFVHIIAFTD